MRKSLSLIPGLLIGLALGVAVGWGLFPPSTAHLTPADLRDDYRYEYILLIAEDYAAEGNLTRAQDQLQAVAPKSIPTLLDAAMGYHLTHRTSEAQLRALAHLAAALHAATPAMQPYLEAP